MQHDIGRATGDYVTAPLPKRRRRLAKIYTASQVRRDKLLDLLPPKGARGGEHGYSLRSLLLPGSAAALGYIPVTLFLSFSVATLGLYPYVWLWSSLHAFERIGVSASDDRNLRRFAVYGFCVQMLFSAMLILYAAGAWLASDLVLELSFRVAVVYAATYLLLILPLRCGCYFDLRWKIRRRVSEWDSAKIMMDRTMSSWFKLFLLGSLYVQYHINRLMGLGMPGFADPSEITDDFAVVQWVRDYVKGEEDRGEPR